MAEVSRMERISDPKYPGLVIETHRNGAIRYRVRVEGDKNKRVTLDISPEHPCFPDAYWAGRMGVTERYSHRFVPIVAMTGNLNRHIYAIIHGAQERARNEGVSCTIKKEDILMKIDEQQGRCAISEVPFDLSRSTSRRRPFAISLDRIQCGGDYSSENVRLATVIANLARSDWGDDALEVMAKGIADKVSRRLAKVSRNP